MVSDRLKTVVLTTLQLDQFPLDDATVASMVPGWDSLNYARIIRAVESEFGIRFKMAEVMRLARLGDLQALIDQKMA
jgi:acyl carrier protein